jgi:hypothetical protein
LPASARRQPLDGRLGAPLDSHLDAFCGFRLRRRWAAFRLARAQEISCLGDRRPALRPADPEPLCLGEALAPRDLELELRLDALRRGDDAEARAEPRDRTHDGERFLVAVGEPGDEGLVDLDLVEGKAAQVAQRGEAGAEVVERYAHAEVAQLVQRHPRRLAVLQKHGLGDLELEPARLDAGGGERAHHELRQVARVELHRREVD